jgi:hypothetical protein
MTTSTFILTHMSWPEVRSALETVRLATFEFGQTIVETTLERTLEFLQSFLQAE